MKWSKYVVVAIALVLVTGLAGCSAPSANAPQGSSPETDEQTVGRVIAVGGAHYAFSPNEIRAKQGETITIEFTSTEGLHDWVLDEFNAATNVVNTNETDSVTFVAGEKGEFEYYCSVGNHREQGMVGTLIVE